MLKHRQIVTAIRVGLAEMARTTVVRFNESTVKAFVRSCTGRCASTKQIADHFGQTQSKVVAMMKRLAAAGQVNRVDGRVITWSA